VNQWFDEDRIQSMVRGGASRKLAADIVQRQRDREDGFSPEEVKQRAVERWLAADYAEAVANLELICEETVTMDEGRNPIRLDAAGIAEARAYLKEHGFPGDEAAHVRIDAFFDDWKYPDEKTDEQSLVVPETREDEEVQEPFRLMSSRPEAAAEAGDSVVSDVEPVENEPVTEPVDDIVEEPDVSEIPPVAFEVEQAARALGVQIWSSGSMPCARLHQGRQAHSVDQYSAHAQNQGWLAVVGDLIVRGEVDPRPVMVTRIPISNGRAVFWGLLWNAL
jgi:hypothetical protein